MYIDGSTGVVSAQYVGHPTIPSGFFVVGSVDLGGTWSKVSFRYVAWQDKVVLATVRNDGANGSGVWIVDDPSISVEPPSPASSFTRRPTIRIVPDNGSEVFTDLQTVLGDDIVRVPLTEYTPEIGRNTTRDRDSVPDMFGFRSRVALEFLLASVEAQSYVTELVDALLRADTSVYLSLDGGFTERRVALSDFRGPEPFRGKTVAGQLSRVEMTALDLLPEIPSSVPNLAPYNAVTNGDFSLWTSPTLPESWFVNGATVAQDSVNYWTSPYSLKITRSGAPACRVQQFLEGVFEPGRWATVVVRGVGVGIAGAGSYGSYVSIDNITKNVTWNGSFGFETPDIGTWDAGSQGKAITMYRIGWYEYRTTIPILSTFGRTDQYKIQLVNGPPNPAGVVSNYDDVLVARISPPSGVAVW
jgi:hypothetical protein